MLSNCQKCQKEFKSKPSQKRKFCSRKCWMDINEKKRTNVCTHCKESYQIPKEGKQPRNRPFCSRKCWDLFQIGKNNPGWKGGMINKNCESCELAFSVKNSDKDARFCSIKCRSDILVGENHPKYQDIHDKCEFCQKEIRITKRDVGKRNFCSQKCSNNGHGVYIKGVFNGRYIHGEHATPYPEGWTRTFKDEIRARDGYRCCWCSMDQLEHKTKLHVHHVDYDKSNISADNLVTLCKFCHGTMHGGIADRELWKEKWKQKQSNR